MYGPAAAVHHAADRPRAAGHEVRVPDMYHGRVVDRPEAGTAVKEEIGLGTAAAVHIRGRAAVRRRPGLRRLLARRRRRAPRLRRFPAGRPLGAQPRKSGGPGRAAVDGGGPDRHVVPLGGGGPRRARLWEDRYTRCEVIVRRAVERGELPSHTDARRLLVAAPTPLYHHLVLLRTPPDPDLPGQAARTAVLAAWAGAFAGTERPSIEGPR
ncbi:TetR-like C-terminal domain-containing protein [Nonomuraea sp. NPDC004702]